MDTESLVMDGIAEAARSGMSVTLHCIRIHCVVADNAAHHLYTMVLCECVVDFTNPIKS